MYTEKYKQEIYELSQTFICLYALRSVYPVQALSRNLITCQLTVERNKTYRCVI